MEGDRQKRGDEEAWRLIFVDSNIFLRSILQDDEEKAKDCLRLLEKIDEGEIEAITSILVINEILWVLEGLGVERGEIIKRMKAIAMSNVGICQLANGDKVLESLSYYDALDVDFVDAMNACVARENGAEQVVSYDGDFERFEFVERIEPSDLID